ncbi:MAG: response regulator transcription factor [Acidobacteriaceae bacterium]
MDSRAPAEPVLKVLVADIDAMTAHLLAADLRRQECFNTVACAPTMESLAHRVPAGSPSILLLSVRSQGSMSEGLRLLKAARTQHNGIRSIVLLDAVEPELVAELFRAGARGIFERSEYDPERLCRCIQCVAAGQVWAKSEQLCFVLDAFVETAPMHILSAKGEELLTPREKDVVRLVADGFGNREVAQQLGLSSHTVKNYLFNIFDKLGISSRAELIMYVLSNTAISAHVATNGEEQTSTSPKRSPLRSHTTKYEDLAG